MKTEEILDKIEKPDDDWYEISKFISSLDLTPEQMELLANHENEDVRYGLALNPNLTEEIMIKLSKDTGMDGGIRRSLAKHPKLPIELLKKLIKHKDFMTRYISAEHPNLSEELIYKLAENKDWRLRNQIISHHNLPKDLLIKLSCDVVNYPIRYKAFKKFAKLKNIEEEELIKAYDLIIASNCVDREYIKSVFDFIIDEFPELSELAKMFKRIILKGKKDLK